MFRSCRSIRFLAALVIAPLIAGCATTGSTFGSGVGDRFVEHPPYTAGVSTATVAANFPRLAYLPVTFHRGASESARFDPESEPGTPVAALVEEMNAYLDSLARASGTIRPLASAGNAAGVAGAAGARPHRGPDVRFGCATESGAPGDDCAARGDGALGRDHQTMHLAVGRPSAEWTAAIQDAVTAAGVDGVLMITLEIGQYLPRQSGMRGDKSGELGTGHVAELPWLTSLETPVPVLQLTGAVERRDGRVARIAAEGIAARRTPLLVSALGAQAIVSEADVESARTHRRENLPGRPLAWQVAVRELLAQLTGQRLPVVD